MYEETNIQLAARNYNDPAPNPGAASYTTGLNAVVRWTSNFTSHITNSVQIAENFQKGTNTLRGQYTLPAGLTHSPSSGNRSAEPRSQHANQRWLVMAGRRGLPDL